MNNKSSSILLKNVFYAYKRGNCIFAFVKLQESSRDCFVLQISADYTNEQIMKKPAVFHRISDAIKLVSGCEYIGDKYLEKIKSIGNYMFDSIGYEEEYHCSIFNILSIQNVLRFLLSSYTIEEFIPEVYGKDWQRYICIYKCNGEQK